jgi:hypothetical protein
MILLARIVRLVAAVVIGFIVVGIVLHVVGANAGNGIVSFVYDVAGWLAKPFDNVFKIHDPKAQVAANWGLAAVVYAIAAALVTRLMMAAGMGIRGRFYRGGATAA